MRVAITGGTGFVGRHLARRLVEDGHEAVLVARGVDQRPGVAEVATLEGVTVAKASVTDTDALTQAFSGCEAVAHCAGINREIGAQTYQAIHVDGSRAVVRAAETAGVRRLSLMSFLRARPACGSAYHESKWAAEELVRGSDLEWTVLKPGLVYGLGDHFLDHLSHALFTFPFYVGIGNKRFRPLWIEDLVDVLVDAALNDHLVGRTLPILGPTELLFDDAAKELARILDRRVLFFRLPMVFHRLLAVISEHTMKVPLVSTAQVRMLSEEIVEPILAPDSLPDDLVPRTPFDEDTIRRGLPPPGRFGRSDLKLGWI